MKKENYKSKSKSELKETLLSLLKEQFTLRMQRGMSEAPKTHLFKQIRKNIARVKTFLNQQSSEA